MYKLFYKIIFLHNLKSNLSKHITIAFYNIFTLEEKYKLLDLIFYIVI